MYFKNRQTNTNINKIDKMKGKKQTNKLINKHSNRI